jgi:predicted permease
MRSFWSVLQVEPGFDPTGVISARVSLPASKYGEAAQRATYFDALLSNVREIPGVETAGMVIAAPLSGFVSNGRIAVEGGPQANVTAAYQVADEGYFEALRIPLLRGRLFTANDRAETPHVVVVNQALAELAWPGEDPLGKRITGGGMDSYWDQPDAWATVVGVVGDIRQRDLERESYPTFYFPYRQRADRAWGAAIVVRAQRVEPELLASPLRQVMREIDGDVPVEIATMDEAVARSLGDRRFTMGVLGVFAAMALLLAALGIYGVVGYTVALRTREMGIRMALGSSPTDVIGMVLRESLTTVSMGLLAGLGAVLALTRLLRSLLFAVSPTDPVAIVSTALTLLAVGLLASLIPALRAARIDPLITMRAD